MLYAMLADMVLVTHLLFVVFVIAGGAAVLRWPRLAWIHVPAVAWGVLIEYEGWICPLTPLENALRRAAGEVTYAGGFLDHYVGPILYPSGLTRRSQVVLGTLLLIGNAVVYWSLARRWLTSGHART